MLYDTSKHALTQDNGTLVATFSPDIRADKCFEYSDAINSATTLIELQCDLETAEENYESLKKDEEILQDKVYELKEEIEKLDDRLQGIITMLECDSVSEYTKEELIKDIIDICAAPL